MTHYLLNFKISQGRDRSHSNSDNEGPARDRRAVSRSRDVTPVYDLTTGQPSNEGMNKSPLEYLAKHDNSTLCSAGESSHSGQQRGELLWDRERERLKRKEKEREAAGAQQQAMMAVAASSAGGSSSSGATGGKSQEEMDMMKGKCVRHLWLLTTQYTLHYNRNLCTNCSHGIWKF